MIECRVCRPDPYQEKSAAVNDPCHFHLSPAGPGGLSETKTPVKINKVEGKPAWISSIYTDYQLFCERILENIELVAGGRGVDPGGDIAG